MAKHNIQFRGIRHAPSDITGQDGDLLECVNLVHDSGELKPIEKPERTEINGNYSNDTLIAVHNLTDGKKFIFTVYNGASSHIHAKDVNNDCVSFNGNNPDYGWGVPNEIKWAETIGNTLIIGTDKSTYYALYKNGQYKWLGDKLPQPVFEFDMGTNSDDECYEAVVEEPAAYCTWGEDIHEDGGIPLDATYDTYVGTDQERYTELLDDSEENLRLIRDNLKAKMAVLMNNTKKEGRFVYPFLCRYAIRMYDGNYVMHSAPILLLPSTTKSPVLALMEFVHNSGAPDSTLMSWGNLVLYFLSKPLKYKFKGFFDESGAEQNADDWGDIIKGVDLFLSSQIVTFNESKYDNFNNIPKRYYNKPPQHPIPGEVYIPDYGKEYSNNASSEWITHYTSEYDMDTLFVDYANVYYKYQYFPLESHSSESIQEKISETSLFYRVKKYDLNKLKVDDWQSERCLNNEIEYGLLDRLETLPTLPDDYVSRCRMTGSVNYNYNQRLVLGNISLQAPKWYQDTKLFYKTGIYNLRICFEIEKPEKTIYVTYRENMDDDLSVGEMDFGHYIFYPDPDCKRAYVAAISGSSSLSAKFILPMHEHTGLHGAYALMPDLKSLYEAAADNDFGNDITLDIPQESTDRYYRLPNTIAMSSVANPFHFPATNFKDIGRTKVIGIAANVLDVSSGQWGQYPLHVFCSDGIIAVAIDAEGKMGRIDAVSADVLNEPRGLSQPTLIQTNQMLVFLTQRGVMAIAGTKVKCLSEAMKGRHFNTAAELDGVKYKIGYFSNLIERTSDYTAFDDFIKSGFLAYDYAHNRVLILRPDREYQYVLSMDTWMWSKQIIYTENIQLDVVPGNTEPQTRDAMPLLDTVPIHAAVNNYTELYLQDTDSYLYKTMDVAGENSVKRLYQWGYFVSRPVRFNTDEYKTIVRTLHRYTDYAAGSFVKLALYGSRDGVKYGRINTLRGMSYQYFIFVIYTYLKPNERYSYMSVEFEPRLNNKIR